MTRESHVNHMTCAAHVGINRPHGNIWKSHGICSTCRNQQTSVPYGNHSSWHVNSDTTRLRYEWLENTRDGTMAFMWSTNSKLNHSPMPTPLHHHYIILNALTLARARNPESVKCEQPTASSRRSSEQLEPSLRSVVSVKPSQLEILSRSSFLQFSHTAFTPSSVRFWGRCRRGAGSHTEFSKGPLITQPSPCQKGSKEGFMRDLKGKWTSKNWIFHYPLIHHYNLQESTVRMAD